MLTCARCGAEAELIGAPGPYLGEPLCLDCSETPLLSDDVTEYTLGGYVRTVVSCGEAGHVTLTGEGCRLVGRHVLPATVEQDPDGSWGWDGPPWIGSADWRCAEAVAELAEDLVGPMVRGLSEPDGGNLAERGAA